MRNGTDGNALRRWVYDRIYLRKICELLRWISDVSLYVLRCFADCFLIFFVSVVYAAQAFGYYLIIRNETYLRRGWSFTYADIITEDGVTSKLCWFTEQRSSTHSFHDFSYDDTLPILYKTKRPKKFIRCDEKYWHDKMCARCVIAMLFGIMILLLIIFGF